jgi:selenocysteine lyase/cysteine desulfurase
MTLNKSAVTELRAAFPALQQTIDGRPIIFLDGPGGTQVHGSVIDAMGRYLVEANSNAHGAFAYSRRTDATVRAAREAMADFVNASRPEEIVFGPNMTTLTFNASRAIGRTLAPGDEIVVTRLDHDANIAPWVALEEKGVIVRHVDFDPADCTLDMAGLEAAINPRTRVVALGYASNAVGSINDVARAAELAHAAGAWLYVDAPRSDRRPGPRLRSPRLLDVQVLWSTCRCALRALRCARRPASVQGAACRRRSA